MKRYVFRARRKAGDRELLYFAGWEAPDRMFAKWLVFESGALVMDKVLLDLTMEQGMTKMEEENREFWDFELVEKA